MAAGMPTLLAGRSRPRAAFGGARGPPAGRRRAVVVRGEAGQQAPRQGLLQLGSALLSATLVLSAGGAVLQPPPAGAESALERRQAEMQRRKELLAAAREKALAGGGQEEGDDPANATASVSVAEEQKVTAANAEVERSNAGRGQEASRMLDGLKSSVQGYEAATSEAKLKPVESRQGPSWLTGLFDKADKPETEAPTSAAPDAPPAAEPKAVEPAPTPAPSPLAFSFGKPKAEEPPPPSPAAPTPPPPPAPQASKPAEASGPSFEFPSFQSLQSLAEPVAKPEPKPEPAPAPAPPPAAPKPAAPAEPPAKKIGPQPVQPVRKEQKAAAAAKPGKRKGPLPAALVQLLLLAGFGGLGYLAFFKEREVDRVLAVVSGAVAAAYKKVASLGKGGKSA